MAVGEILRVWLFNYSLHWWSAFSYSTSPKNICTPCSLPIFYVLFYMLASSIFCFCLKNSMLIECIQYVQQNQTNGIFSCIQIMSSWYSKKKKQKTLHHLLRVTCPDCSVFPLHLCKQFLKGKHNGRIRCNFANALAWLSSLKSAAHLESFIGSAQQHKLYMQLNI